MEQACPQGIHHQTVAAQKIIACRQASSVAAPGVFNHQGTASVVVPQPVFCPNQPLARRRLAFLSNILYQIYT
jgi:hypothetical protein